MDSAELALPPLFERINPSRGGSPNRGGSLSRLYARAGSVVHVCLPESTMCVRECMFVCALFQWMCVTYCISSRIAFLTGWPCRTWSFSRPKKPCRTVLYFSCLCCCLAENHRAAGASGKGITEWVNMQTWRHWGGNIETNTKKNKTTMNRGTDTVIFQAIEPSDK